MQRVAAAKVGHVDRMVGRRGVMDFVARVHEALGILSFRVESRTDHGMRRGSRRDGTGVVKGAATWPHGKFALERSSRKFKRDSSRLRRARLLNNREVIFRMTSIGQAALTIELAAKSGGDPEDLTKHIEHWDEPPPPMQLRGAQRQLSRQI